MAEVHYTALPSHEAADGFKPVAPPPSEGTRNTVPGRAIASYHPRVKKSRLMRWLVLHATGTKQFLHLDKRQLIQYCQIDIPMRDMRLLDPVMVTPAYGGTSAMQSAAQGGSGQLLVRDNAIVLALEHVRIIITADKVVIPLLEEKNELQDGFVSALESSLQDRLADTCGGMSPQAATPLAGPSPRGALPGGVSWPHLGPSSLGNSTDKMHSASHYNLHPSHLAHPPPSTAHDRGAGNATISPFAAQGAAWGFHQRQNSVGGAAPADNKAGGPTGVHTPTAIWQAAAASGRTHGGSHQQYPSTLGSDGGAGLYGTGVTPRGRAAADAEDLHPQGSVQASAPASQRGGSAEDELAFELWALEAGLGEVCHHLAREVDTLQAAATPVLDDLITSSDRRNLERVRRIKTHHQRLINRVQVVRDALHRIMEDDADMFRMCLSRQHKPKPTNNNGSHSQLLALNNLVGTAAAGAPPSTQQGQQAAAAAADGSKLNTPALPRSDPVPMQGHDREVGSFSAPNLQGINENATATGSPPTGSRELVRATSPLNHRMSMDLPLSPEQLFSLSSMRSPSMLAVKLLHMQHVHQQASAAAAAAAAAADSQGGKDAPAGAAVQVSSPLPPTPVLDEDDLHDVLDVENLLEAYNIMAESTHATLVNIGEYIDDTEDLVNINLDYSRNKLIRFELLITMGTFSLAFYACFAGVLGENLVLPPAFTKSLTGFFLVNGTLIGCSFAIFYILYTIIKSQKLL